MIETEIKDILAKQFGINFDVISLNQYLVDDLNADSLDLVEITMTLETKYKIVIEDDEADLANTVQKLINLVNKKLHD